MKKLLASTALSLCYLGLPPAAHAALIEWTLTDVTFDDKGTAYGSFVHDTTTGEISNIRVSTTQGSKGAAANFRSRCTTNYCAQFPLDFIFTNTTNPSDLTNAAFIDIELTAPLPNTPSTLTLEPTGAGTCSNASCSQGKADYRMAFTGSLVGKAYIAPPVSPASVPTIGQWGLLLLTPMLGAVAFLRQRRHF